MKKLWEVLVPRYSNAGLEFSLDHHHSWDAYVRGVAGGITIFRTARGEWINPEGKVFKDEMIPVRVYCEDSQLEQILTHTISHYDQEAVFAYEVSNNVRIKHR